MTTHLKMLLAVPMESLSCRSTDDDTKETHADENYIVDTVSVDRSCGGAGCTGRRILYTSVADDEVERIKNDLAFADVAVRRETICRAGWLRDARVAPLLVKAAKDMDAEVARQAIIGLRRMTWDAVLAMDEDAFDLLVAELNSQNAGVRSNAVSALGSVGGEKTLYG
ncbi:MAG: HEAT repeat domain-containing protein [Planctomycetota bacterium]